MCAGACVRIGSYPHGFLFGSSCEHCFSRENKSTVIVSRPLKNVEAVRSLMNDNQ